LISFSWQAPRHLNMFLRGWQLAGTGIAHTGPPFTPTNSNANLALGEASRPNRIAKGSVPNPTPTHWFDPADFPVVPDGSFAFGNSGRDIIDGPGQIAINTSFSRNFAIQERKNLQFRWEVFNILNHPNFPLPVATVNTANAGTIQSAADPRTMQAALRFTF
jgi:hypothetical protein